MHWITSLTAGALLVAGMYVLGCGILLERRGGRTALADVVIAVASGLLAAGSVVAHDWGVGAFLLAGALFKFYVAHASRGQVHPHLRRRLP